MDNQNALRHDGETKSPIVLNSAQGTTWWPILVFNFFIEFIEVDAYLAMRYFLKTDETSRKFRGELSKALI